MLTEEELIRQYKDLKSIREQTYKEYLNALDYANKKRKQFHAAHEAYRNFIKDHGKYDE